MPRWFFVIRCSFFLSLPAFLPYANPLRPNHNSKICYTDSAPTISVVEPLAPSTTLPQPKHKFKMSDVEGVSTISAVDRATTVTKPEGKPKVNKKAANGGKRWTSEQVSFPV
jgi:hypothetical protein